MCITESWLDSSITDNELCIDEYSIIRLDRNRHGGGVALYIDYMLRHKIIYLGNVNFECVIVTVNVGSCKICVGVVYRPPSSSSVEFLDSLYNTLCSLDVDLFSNFILVGDLNIDFLSQTHQHFSQLLSITTSFLLHQVITTPTHFSHLGTPSIIDLAFVSHSLNLISCCTSPPLSNSDHLGISVVCTLSTQFKRPKTPRRSVWCYTLGDFQKACELLRDVDWTSLLRCDDVDECWSKWHNQFIDVMTQCIPRKLLPQKKNLPWINQPLLAAIRRRNSLFKKYKATRCESVFNEYKFVRNRLTFELRKAKQSFFNQLHHADSKTFWKLYKTLTRKVTNIPALHRPSLTGMAEDSLEKVNLLNAQFFKNFNSSNASMSTRVDQLST